MAQMFVSGYSVNFVGDVSNALKGMYTEIFTLGGEEFGSFSDFLNRKLPSIVKSCCGARSCDIEKRSEHDDTFSEFVNRFVKLGLWGAFPPSDAKIVHQLVTDEDSRKTQQTLDRARNVYFANHGGTTVISRIG
jgi:hypothetical protein